MSWREGRNEILRAVHLPFSNKTTDEPDLQWRLHRRLDSVVEETVIKKLESS